MADRELGIDPRVFDTRAPRRHDLDRIFSPAKVGAMLALVLALLISAHLYQRTIATNGVLMWDEAAHNLWGRLIFEDITRTQWLALALDTYRQDYWPPMHSWYLSLFF